VTSRRGYVRLLPAVVVLGVLAYLAGLSLVARQPRYHPLTGRQIAGIATDARWMDRISRESEETPELALDLIGITPGTVVADVGAGSGYMTTRLAQRVGPGGQVLAEDIQPGLLSLLHDKLERDHIRNVELIVGTEDDAGLPADAVDLVLLVDVYHELSRPAAMMQSLKRALKPSGRLVLVEYRKEDPSIPIADIHRMSIAEIRNEVEAEGFRFNQAIERLPRQHIVIFRK